VAEYLPSKLTALSTAPSPPKKPHTKQKRKALLFSQCYVRKMRDGISGRVRIVGTGHWDTNHTLTRAAAAVYLGFCFSAICLC
jgi:hypothetical protein